MRSYDSQPYKRHKVRLDGYDVNYIMTSLDIDDQVTRQLANP